jgi:hypothetical protein
MTYLKFLLFVCAFIGVALFCKKQTDGFRIDKISSKLRFHPEWEVKRPEPQDLLHIKKILRQPFRYLGKGAQTFVFASADGKYIIKFFRYDHMGDAPFLKKLPFKRAERRVARLQNKLNQDFTSYKLAYDHMKEETALLYVHLNKTDDLGQKIELIDKLGISHCLPLDGLEFVVQRKATLLYPALNTLIHKGQEKEGKELISCLIALLVKRCQKELFDKDPDLLTNFGVVEGKVVQIDPGRFKKDPSESKDRHYKDEIIRITDKLHLFLKQESLALAEELEKQLEEIL